jgi:hypothetical protein
MADSQTHDEEVTTLNKPLTRVFVKNFKDFLEDGKGSFEIVLNAFSKEGDLKGSLTLEPSSYWQNAVAQNTLQTIAGPICLAVDSSNPQAVSDLIDLNEVLETHTRRVKHSKKLNEEREYKAAEKKLSKRKGTLVKTFC